MQRTFAEISRLSCFHAARVVGDETRYGEEERKKTPEEMFIWEPERRHGSRLFQDLGLMTAEPYWPTFFPFRWLINAWGANLICIISLLENSTAVKSPRAKTKKQHLKLAFKLSDNLFACLKKNPHKFTKGKEKRHNTPSNQSVAFVATSFASRSYFSFFIWAGMKKIKICARSRFLWEKHNWRGWLWVTVSGSGTCFSISGRIFLSDGTTDMW